MGSQAESKTAPMEKRVEKYQDDRSVEIEETEEDEDDDRFSVISSASSGFYKVKTLVHSYTPKSLSGIWKEPGEEDSAAEQIKLRIQDVQRLKGMEAEFREGGGVREHKSRMKTHRDCFMGRAFVDWLCEKGKVGNRIEGTEIGQTMMDHNILRHLKDEKQFSDSDQLFRFLSDERAEKVKGILKLKGVMKMKQGDVWVRYFFAVSGKQLMRFQPDSEQPEHTFDLCNARLVPPSSEEKHAFAISCTCPGSAKTEILELRCKSCEDEKVWKSGLKKIGVV